MIFPIITWLNLDSLGQNNQPINCYFSPSDCPAVQAIATFQASNFQSQVYSSDCPCILADITKRLPSQPSDCLAFPSDCLLCAITKRLLLLGKRLLAGRYEFSSFHRGLTCVLLFPINRELLDTLSLFIELKSLSLSLS